MTPQQACDVHEAMRQFGIPGVVAPEAPDDREGSWRVYDAANPYMRTDITDHVLARIAAARTRQPERGFVFTR
ncbi:hypothetical protein [Streptomyces xanthophaeus]|uniref:hypothetical protein n=1 Tax=Streptomyces xanthophaeus TaxID=67385 RepID=UPI002649603C|nr:hypothetical protein [Streptomyces xanthophaeus]WKD36487.1 hypothetical protein KO717_34185 [Streptomyces xanthophaeus]